MQVIQLDINISSTKLTDGLRPLVQMIYQLNKFSSGDIVIDFSKAKFVSPLFVTTLQVLSDKSKLPLSFANHSDYMYNVYAHSPVNPAKMRKSEFIALMARYEKKTYIPIVCFPAGNDNDSKDEILRVIESLIINQAGIPSNVAQGLKYMVSEMIDNIVEHSNSRNGYIFAQSYPKLRYLDICIADSGITLLGSYRESGKYEIDSDIEALSAANRGISTKNLPNAENRGFGIGTTKKMLIDGLGGQYMMMSGGAIHIKSSDIDNNLNLPEDIRIDGTVVAMRIPYNKNNFNYINYIEL